MKSEFQFSPLVRPHLDFLSVELFFLFSKLLEIRLPSVTLLGDKWLFPTDHFQLSQVSRGNVPGVKSDSVLAFIGCFLRVFWALASLLSFFPGFPFTWFDRLLTSSELGVPCVSFSNKSFTEHILMVQSVRLLALLMCGGQLANRDSEGQISRVLHQAQLCPTWSGWEPFWNQTAGWITTYRASLTMCHPSPNPTFIPADATHVPVWREIEPEIY